MKRTLFAAVMLFPATAFAGTADDLVECMVGKAAAALHGQSAGATPEQREAAKLEALEIAYGGCGLEEADAEQEAAYAEVADYVALMVERMAAD